MGNRNQRTNSNEDQPDRVYEKLSDELKKLCQQYSESCSKPNYVLRTVHDNVANEWRTRLEEAKVLEKQDCIILIPYEFTDTHWIGIFIKCARDGSIERAEFVDSFSRSYIDLDRLQNSFAQIYPTIVLQSANSRKYDDLEESSDANIRTLLRLVEELQYSTIDESNNDEFFDAENDSLPEVEVEGEGVLKYKIEAEQLENLYNDFFAMPSCIEKSVLSLHFYISLKLHGKTVEFNKKIFIPEKIEKEVENECLYMKERLELERESSSMILNLLKQLSECIRKEDWKSSLALVNKALMRIRPLNISELFRIIKRVDTTAEKIKNKDIILFLGGTGSGKSTLIHFFAGSKMEWQKVKGLNHIAPTKIMNPEAKHITTSPFAMSETRYIIPVTVNFTDVGNYRKGSIMLCDSPGFGDTRSPEVDIGNAIAIVKVIRECKSILPVVLISYQSIGDRSEGLKTLAYTLTGLIQNIADTIDSFSYIFTKYPPDERDDIHAKLKNILDTVNDQEESDMSFMTVFRDMLHKTEDGALCIDVTTDKPGKILDKLMGKAPINHPEEIFRFSTTIKSKTILYEQISTYQMNIKSALERFEYDLIKHRLDQLKRLNDELDQKYIDAYKECIHWINQHLEKEYEIAIAFFDRCLFEQRVLNVKDIEEYKIYIDRAVLAEKLRNDHLGEQSIHCSAFNQHIERQVIRMCSDLGNKSIDDALVKTYLDKIKLLSNCFSAIADKYREICQILSDKIDHVVQTCETSTSSHQFDQSATMIS